MNSPSFRLALANTLRREGGFVDDPDDQGGATHYGISLRYLRAAHRLGHLDGDLDQDGDVDADDIRQLKPEDAADIYYAQFWQPNRYAEMTPTIAAKAFDLAVNLGPSRANRLLQHALRAARHPVDVDGRIGPQTLGAVRSATDRGAAGEVLAALRAEAAGVYRRLVANRPELGKWERGWLRRAYDE